MIHRWIFVRPGFLDTETPILNMMKSPLDVRPNKCKWFTIQVTKGFRCNYSWGMLGIQHSMSLLCARTVLTRLRSPFELGHTSKEGTCCEFTIKPDWCPRSTAGTPKHLQKFTCQKSSMHPYPGASFFFEFSRQFPNAETLNGFLVGYDSFCSSPPAYQHLNSGFLMGRAEHVPLESDHAVSDQTGHNE